MRIINKSKLPNSKIREIVNFVKPSGIKNFDIIITNTSTGWHYGCARRNQVLIRLSDKEKFPFIHDCGKPYLPILLLTEDESLIQIFAHELRHVYQHQHGNKRLRNKIKIGKKVGKETDADVYAIRKVREWRRRQPQPIISLNSLNELMS